MDLCLLRIDFSNLPCINWSVYLLTWHINIINSIIRFISFVLFCCHYVSCDKGLVPWDLSSLSEMLEILPRGLLTKAIFDTECRSHHCWIFKHFSISLTWFCLNYKNFPFHYEHLVHCLLLTLLLLEISTISSNHWALQTRWWFDSFFPACLAPSSEIMCITFAQGLLSVCIHWVMLLTWWNLLGYYVALYSSHSFSVFSNAYDLYTKHIL